MKLKVMCSGLKLQTPSLCYLYYKTNTHLQRTKFLIRTKAISLPKVFREFAKTLFQTDLKDYSSQLSKTTTSSKL